MAQQRFDKVVSRLVIGTIIAFMIAVGCLIATICVIFKFQAFINQFEYVEETTYEIEQDEGINQAVIGNNNDLGVVLDGTNNHREDQEVLAQKERQ
jgi:hypothetical protein